MCKVLIGGTDGYFYENIFKYIIDDFLRQTCINIIGHIELEHRADSEWFLSTLDEYKPDIIILDQEFFELNAAANIIEKEKVIHIGYGQKGICDKDELFRLFFKNLQERPCLKDMAHTSAHS